MSNKDLRKMNMPDAGSSVSFDEFNDASAPTGRTSHDNTFVKRIGSGDYLFNRVVIPADKIKDMVKAHHLNPRIQSLLNPVSLAKLISDIKKTGGVQQPPICVCVDGVYYSIDGSRRTEACSLIGMPLTIEYTCDNVPDSDCELYIASTDVNTNQSVFEKSMVVFNNYIDFKSNWERTRSDRFKDEYFFDEFGIAKSHLGRIKKICTIYNYRFFENGDTNKFGYRELLSMAGVVLKQRVNCGSDEFDAKVDNVFGLCLSEFGDDWDVENFKDVFATEFNIKRTSPVLNDNRLCVITVMEDGELVDKNVSITKKKESFVVEVPVNCSDEIKEKLKQFILATFDD